MYGDKHLPALFHSNITGYCSSSYIKRNLPFISCYFMKVELVVKLEFEAKTAAYFYLLTFMTSFLAQVHQSTTPRTREWTPFMVS